MSIPKFDAPSLRPWLFDLVSGDPSRRLAAAKELSSAYEESFAAQFQAGVPLTGVVASAFAVAVRRALSVPEVDAPAYVRRLADFCREAKATRMAIWRRAEDRADRLSDRIGAELNAEGTQADRKATLMRRFARVLCTGCDPRTESARAEEEWMAIEMAAGHAFRALGPLVLDAPDVIRDMLAVSDEAWQATRVLESLGPRAAAFVDDLFRLLDRSPRHLDSTLYRVFANLLADDPNRAYRLVARLGAADRETAAAAAGVLWELGPRATALVPDVVATLLARTGADCPTRAACLSALGRVAAGDESVVRPLLALSRDAEMWVRGLAITALGDVARRPDIVVPRLIEAFADYEEPDPDCTHGSAHERVVDALGAFGPAAAAAVPALLARLKRNGGDEVDLGVVKTLGAVGPAAAAALPALEALMAEDAAAGEDDDGEGLPEEWNPVRTAIRRIRA
jgi:hypothetical protein